MANQVSYQRMLDALKTLQKQHAVPSLPLVRVLFNHAKPSFADTPQVVFLDNTLNDPQRDAIQFALSANELALIHGPAGTGKTYTLIELIRQLVQSNQRVLVCGPSNLSVDNLVERLSKHRLNMVRLGHPARLLNSVLPYSLDIRVKSSDDGAIVNDIRKEVDQTLSAASKAKNRSDKRALYSEIKILRKELRVREATVLDSIIRNAQVVLCTLNGAASRQLERQDFDVVIIDEAAQAIEAECWIAILKGKKLVLAGDHLQLPPTIKSTKPGLQVTLFDRMLELHGSKIKKLLSVQYRMELYDGKLVAFEGVKDHLLCQLPGVSSTEETIEPLVFMDTAGHEWYERSEGDDRKDMEGDSKMNEGEAGWVCEHVEKLIKAGVNPIDIAIISPYNAQVNHLKGLLKPKYPSLEIGSVDGFQGREKEAVIISMVRSNDKGEIGFLQERRRMNVALTRARRHLAVIGDSDTVGQKSVFLKKMIQYFEENGELLYPEM